MSFHQSHRCFQFRGNKKFARYLPNFVASRGRVGPAPTTRNARGGNWLRFGANLGLWGPTWADRRPSHPTVTPTPILKSSRSICIDKARSFLSWRSRGSPDNAERSKRKLASFRRQAGRLATNVGQPAPILPNATLQLPPSLKKNDPHASY